MPRLVPRRLLTDAALALGMLAVTVGPGLVTALLVTKPGDPSRYLERAGVPTDTAWWVCAGLVLAGLLIRQHVPLAALALAGAGTLGHLFIQTKFQLLDLALPLVLYTVASLVRKRRLALAMLALTLVLAYLATLGSRLEADRLQKATALDKLSRQQVVDVVVSEQAAKAAKAAKMSAPTGAISIDVLVDSGQSVLEMWLLLVAAFAVGDGMRSRRAHLAAVEQRTADLAREERQRAALAVAAERARLTRELHDVVAHGMAVMVAQAQGAAAALGRHPDRAATAMQHVIETGRSSLDEMRRLLAAGRTDPAEGARLAPLPGISAVPALVDQLRSAGMRIDLRIEGEPEAVPAAVDLSAYRIVQEALTNTLKHAGPEAAAEVLLAFEPEALRIEVADDGRGPDEGAFRRGNGLRGIAERVTLLDGELRTERGEKGGFRLSAMLPLRARVTLAIEQ